MVIAAPFEDALLTYSIPVSLGILAWVPLDFILLIFFSAHGGLGWLLALLAFPILLTRVFMLLMEGSSDLRSSRRRRSVWVTTGYFPISFASAYSMMLALGPSFNREMFDVLLWFYFPVSLIIPR
jgi:hypothetical protein